jgi:large subunit ribosomal protein L25
VTAADVDLPEGVELAVEPEFVLAIVSQAQTAEQMEGGETAEAAGVSESGDEAATEE